METTHLNFKTIKTPLLLIGIVFSMGLNAQTVQFNIAKAEIDLKGVWEVTAADTLNDSFIEYFEFTDDHVFYELNRMWRGIRQTKRLVRDEWGPWEVNSDTLRITIKGEWDKFGSQYEYGGVHEERRYIVSEMDGFVFLRGIQEGDKGVFRLKRIRNSVVDP